MEFKGTNGWFLDKEGYLKDNNFNIIADFFITNQQDLANAKLASKAPEMLEKLSEIVNILDIKCTDGCVNKTWGDFQNGNGEDVGLEIDKFIKDTEQLIKEATEL